MDEKINQNQCFMLIGIPGSGKSTLTQKLLAEQPLEIVSSDAFIDKKAQEEHITYEHS